MTKTEPLKLFDKLTDTIKRLILDYDLGDKEAEKLANTVDLVNVVRENYIDNKLKRIKEDNGKLVKSIH